MLIFLSLFFIIGLYTSAYVVSLYSLAVYIDPEEVETLFPETTRRRREFLRKLAADPRAFLQIAIVYKSFALIAVTALITLIIHSLTKQFGTQLIYLYPIGFVLVWMIQIFSVEYFSRRQARRAVKAKMLKYLWLITIVYIIIYPVVSVYRKALRRGVQEDQITEQDKEDIVERAIETLAEQAGIGEAIVEEDEKEMIGHIFELDETIVREIMVPRVDIVGIEKNLPFKDIQSLVYEEGYSRYPVYEETIDKIIGVVYIKDIFNKLPAAGEKFDIKKYLRQPYFVPEKKVIGQLLREFQMKKLHIAIVVDEFGGIAGLVTLEDIVEEILGEIQDEHDTEEAEFRQISDNEYIVDANLLVEELQDNLDLDNPQGDYDTVGGLIYDLVGSVPKEGVMVKWHQVMFEVLKVEGQRISSVKVILRRKNNHSNS